MKSRSKLILASLCATAFYAVKDFALVKRSPVAVVPEGPIIEQPPLNKLSESSEGMVRGNHSNSTNSTTNVSSPVFFAPINNNTNCTNTTTDYSTYVPECQGWRTKNISGDISNEEYCIFLKGYGSDYQWGLPLTPEEQRIFDKVTGNQDSWLLKITALWLAGFATAGLSAAWIYVQFIGYYEQNCTQNEEESRPILGNH